MNNLQNNNFLEQINKVFLRIKEAAKKDQNILAVYFFGSLLKNYANHESDFDLAVVVDKKKQDSQDSIYELIRNIQFPKNLDLSVVDQASSPLFLFQVISKGQRIYERNRNDMVQFETFVLHNYYDTVHLRAIYAKHLKDKFLQATYAN